MQVVMKVQISGTRDGVEWPPVGESINVPADEAESLIANGCAIAAAKGATVVEAAVVAPAAESATVKRNRK